jgi:hypothetical protein
VLFIDVPEIKIKVRDRGLTGIARSFHIFNDCRTGEGQETQSSFDKSSESSTNQSMLLPEPAKKNGMLLGGVRRQSETGTRFP